MNTTNIVALTNGVTTNLMSTSFTIGISGGGILVILLIVLILGFITYLTFR
jgi:hypothetical protein